MREGFLIEDKVRYIIENGSILSYFQPIIDISSNRIIGFEALSRGYHEPTLEIISPLLLFQFADYLNMSLELDRLCRYEALTKFKEFSLGKDYLLFLNIDVRLVDKGVLETGWLYKTVSYVGIDSSSVIIEITEHNVKSINELYEFAKKYKNYGFNIALDDFGEGSSNFEHLINISPQVIKISGKIIKDLDTREGFIKRNIVESINYFGNKIDSLVLAENVETTNELINLIDIGINLYQGYIFGKPSQEPLTELDESFVELKEECLFYKEKSFFSYIKLIESISYAFKSILESFKNSRKSFYKKIINLTLNKYDEIDCIYICDKNGTLLFDTLCRNITISKLFKPLLKKY